MLYKKVTESSSIVHDHATLACFIRELRVGSLQRNLLSTYLQSTTYSDAEHPAIQHLARTLTQDCPTDAERARQLFYWVRDEIAFQISDWNYRASETLERRQGTCSNKANLLVSLARSLGIPGGFHVMRVEGKAYFGPIVTPTLRRQIRDRSLHVYAALIVNHQWVRCDPSDDTKFSVNTAHLNPQSALIEWDGKHDALLHLNQAHILEDQGPLGTIDDYLSRKPQLPKFIARLGNLYIQFLREHGAEIEGHAALDPAFRQWLRGYVPLGYVAYTLLSWWRGR